MKVLCFFPISNNVSISVLEDDKVLINLYLGIQHQLVLLTNIFDFIKKVINLEEIDRVFVVNGPGYFTTVRIFCISAQTFAFVMNKELTFIDTFTALSNIYKTIYKNVYLDFDDPLFVIKIASKRYRIKSLSLDLETINLEEVLKITKNQNKKLVFSNFDRSEIGILKDYGIDFYDLTNFVSAANAYLSSINDLNFSNDYEVKVVY